MRQSLLVLLLCPALAFAQSVDVPSTHPDEFIHRRGFIVVADRRIFTLMAFLNAVGYDEVQGKPMHPVRVKVRELVAANLEKHPEEVAMWKRRYAVWRLPIFVYLDFALSLSPDYPFKRVYADDKLGYRIARKRLRDLPQILNEFWNAAQLESVWEAVKPDYLAEIRKYSLERMESELAFTWQYLRMPRQDSFILVNIFNPLEKYYQGIAAAYGRYYYSVESPGASDYTINVHEYLHHFINPLIEAAAAKQKKKLDAYYQAGRKGPMAQSYQQRAGYTSECLIRALDARIEVKLNAERRAKVETRIENETAKGLILVRPFYDLLGQFEESNQSFDQFLPVLLEKLPDYKPAPSAG